MIFIIESAAVCVALLSLVLCGIRIVGKEDNRYLTLENTLPIRGLLAVCIVLHHASGYFTKISFLAPFRHIGYLVVALFFFLSGYGLMYGLEMKDKYMDGFLKKRLISILIPYWICNTVYFAATLMMGGQISVEKYLLSMVLLKVINGSMWYVQLLVLFYALFYIAFSRKKNYMLFCSLFLLFYAGGFVLGIDDLYTQSVLAFPLGMVWCINKERLDKAMEAYYRVGLLLAVGITVLGFGLKIAGTLCTSDLIIRCGNNISAVTFCVLAIWIVKIIRISNKTLCNLGSISYEIYLIHMLVLNIVWKVEAMRNHPMVYVAGIFALTYVLALTLNRVGRFVITKLNKSLLGEGS